MYRSYVCNYTSNTYRTVSIIVFDIMSRIELIKQSKKTERLFNDPVKKKVELQNRKLTGRRSVKSKLIWWNILSKYLLIWWTWRNLWFKISWESLPNYLTHFLVYILYSIRNVLGNRFQIQIFHESPYF